MALPPFFRGVSGGRTNGKQGECMRAHETTFSLTY